MDHRNTIQSGLDYIEENLKTEITAQELAAQAGFSLFHYYRLFQTATGMPVMQYILRRRLLHAIYDIRRGQSGIQAALDYGFDTYAGFYRAFHRELGCTPSEFLKHCRAKQPCRINLTQEEHIMITRKKAAQMLSYWALQEEYLSDIYYENTGAKNDNAYYVGDAHVLKFTTNLGKLKNHIALSRAIESVGLWAASSVPTKDGRDYIQDGELYFYLTRRLPGTQIKAESLYTADPAANGRFVGEIIGQLHLAIQDAEACVEDGDLFSTVKSWAMPRVQTLLGLSDSFCAHYLDTFGALYSRLPRQMIHRDPNPGNIIRSDDKWGFIDFELSQREIRIFDPCYAATALLSESFGTDNDKWLIILESILLGYDSIVHLTEEERRAVPYVILANQLVCTAWFADQEKHGALFATNARMSQWLIGKLF